MLAVLVLALMPQSAHLPSTGWDKSNHFLAFMVLAYGALIEGLQSLTPDRSAEWADWLTDSLGLLLGWWLHAAIIPKIIKIFHQC
jgi:VanZ family protein